MKMRRMRMMKRTSRLEPRAQLGICMGPGVELGTATVDRYCINDSMNLIKALKEKKGSVTQSEAHHAYDQAQSELHVRVRVTVHVL